MSIWYLEIRSSRYIWLECSTNLWFNSQYSCWLILFAECPSDYDLLRHWTIKLVVSLLVLIIEFWSFTSPKSILCHKISFIRRQTFGPEAAKHEFDISNIIWFETIFLFSPIFSILLPGKVEKSQMNLFSIRLTAFKPILNFARKSLKRHYDSTRIPFLHYLSWYRFVGIFCLFSLFFPSFSLLTDDSISSVP